jgi:hypothetical protein
MATYGDGVMPLDTSQAPAEAFGQRLAAAWNGSRNKGRVEGEAPPDGRDLRRHLPRVAKGNRNQRQVIEIL